VAELVRGDCNCCLAGSQGGAISRSGKPAHALGVKLEALCWEAFVCDSTAGGTRTGSALWIVGTKRNGGVNTRSCGNWDIFPADTLRDIRASVNGAIVRVVAHGSNVSERKVLTPILRVAVDGSAFVGRDAVGGDVSCRDIRVCADRSSSRNQLAVAVDTRRSGAKRVGGTVFTLPRAALFGDSALGGCAGVGHYALGAVASEAVAEASAVAADALVTGTETSPHTVGIDREDRPRGKGQHRVHV